MVAMARNTGMGDAGMRNLRPDSRSMTRAWRMVRLVRMEIEMFIRIPVETRGMSLLREPKSPPLISSPSLCSIVGSLELPKQVGKLHG